ncbi:hypothetical protein DL96DRAFT_1689350 [Flagelloscypha sp. PMI_526]|nr:hypothetical protein DL96DRAFT_1689350 [Flagelloscypha sp. PMI_526]
MPASGALPPPGKGLRLLSFDGGGIHVVSQALMVREMTNRIEADQQLSSPAKVCDYFDMICGSGFGGLLAIMYGILKMTADEVVHEFVTLCKAVFSEDLDITQRTVVLENEIKRIIGKYSPEGEERRMFCEDDTCKTFVCAASSQNTAHPRLFRNYRSRINVSFVCMLWEAARATTAMLDLFYPIIIGDTHIREKFVSGELRWNNATNELTREAALVFKDRRITSIINIGSGHPGHMSLSKGFAELFPRIALDCERVADDMERRFSRTPEAFWRLNVEQGLQNLATDPPNLDALVSHTHSYLQDARTTRSIDSLLQDLTRRPERIPVDGISGLAPVILDVPRRKLCPPPTQHFTGRRTDLMKLDEYFSLKRESTVCRVGVLYGIGGGGKSQMGLEFIGRSHSRFTDVFFVDASDQFILENDLKTIAIGVSDKPTIENAFRILRTTKEEWLLFLDNADDPSLDLRPYITWPHRNILITTRNHEVRIHTPNCNIWVHKLDLDDAKELLLRGVAVTKSPETYNIASDIVQKLGCLALAVNQARGFLTQDICTLSEYLSIYMQNRKKLLEDKLIQTTDGYEHTVYTTWTMSFKQLSSPAVFILELLCFLHHDAIPSRVFEDACSVLEEQAEAAVPATLFTFLSGFKTADSTWDILRFRMLVKEILSFSLIEFNASNHTFSVHPLVQQWGRIRCHHWQEVVRSAQTLLSLAVPRGDSKEDIMMKLSLLPHLRTSAQNGFDVHFTLLRDVGLGQYSDALKLEQQVLTLGKQILGEEHPDILTTMSRLASTYSSLGQYKDALTFQEQETDLGQEHSSTLISMRNLGMTYSRLGQHRDAMNLGKQVLALSTQVLGEGHPDTLRCILSLASSYSGLGQHRDALRLEEQTLALMTQILGEEHPDTIGSMNNLAFTYFHLGRHNDALKLQEKVLALMAQILGEEHRDTLTCMNNFACTYSYLGQHKDALELLDQALVLWKRILGDEHPNTLCSMSNLASAYGALGRHQDALQLHDQAFSIRTRVLGPEHPQTIISMNCVEACCNLVAREEPTPALGKRKGFED